MSKEFLAALEQIEYEKGIPKDELITLIEHAVEKCLLRHYPLASRYRVKLNGETGEVHAWGIKKAVEKVSNPRDEILLSAALAIDPKAKIDCDVEVTIDVGEIARIASQTIEKVISQRIREYEKSSVFKKYKKLEHKIITGRIFRFIGRKAIVDLGDTEAVLPACEQIPKQFLRLNSHVRAYVMEVVGDERKNDVVLSRTHPDFLKVLLAEEVPEVKEGIVEVLKVVRSPGLRAKVLVKSNNDKIDPVGTCIGVRGNRIKQIINELAGEKIDLIASDLKPKKLIAASLSPARVDESQVSLNKKAMKATVEVPSDQRAKVLGADGINISLACRISGWDIDVVTTVSSEKGEAKAKEENETKESKADKGDESIPTSGTEPVPEDKE